MAIQQPAYRFEPSLCVFVGALGNLVSLLVWSQGVPDPLVVSGTLHGVAFNLADLFAVTGDALLLSAVVLHGIRHRARLRESV